VRGGRLRSGWRRESKDQEKSTACHHAILSLLKKETRRHFLCVLGALGVE
jgi:hypothetical protein